MLAFSHSSELAGAERSLIQLLREGNAMSLEAVGVLPRGGPLQEEFRKAGIPNTRVWMRQWMGARHRGLPGLARLLQSLIATLPCIAAIRHHQPDVVVVNSTVLPAPLLAARFCGVPSVLMARESLRTNPTLLSVLPKRLIAGMLLRLPTRIVAVSEFAADQLCDAAGTTRHPKISVVYNDVPARQLEEGGPYEGGCLRLVMLGTLSEEKGQQDAVTAVRQLLAEGLDVSLDIYGPGTVRAQQRLIASIGGDGGRIVYRGALKDVSKVFKGAHASLVCSRNEAFGLVTAESLLAGVPVVAYARGGTVEILRGGGGLLVEPTPEALAAGIRALHDEPSVHAELRHLAKANDLLRRMPSGAHQTMMIARELVAAR